MRTAREKLDEAFTGVVTLQHSAVANVIVNMLLYTPEFYPDAENAELQDAPFFSEAYLYQLMGKEDARTILSFISDLCRAIGYDSTWDFIEAHVEQLKPILANAED